MLGCHVQCRKWRMEEVGILVAGIPCLHLLPNMVTVVRRMGIVCSPYPGMEREETGVVWISLSIFCLYFLETEHTGASFPKPLLRIAAWDAVVSTAEFTAFLIQWQELGSHTGGFGKAMVSIALSPIYKGRESLKSFLPRATLDWSAQGVSSQWDKRWAMSLLLNSVNL